MTDQAIEEPTGPNSAAAAAPTEAETLRQVCVDSIAGLPPATKVARTTADMVKMGYPVKDPNKEFCEVTVAELTAFLNR